MEKRRNVDENSFNDSMNACFSAFDKDSDGKLSIEEFSSVCKALFRNDDGIVYNLEDAELKDIFDVFDTNRDGFIDIDEFILCWSKWIKIIVRPISGLLIIDVQNDFISGSLSISRCPAKHNGEEVVEPINRLIDTVPFDAIAYSYDWHPLDHISFITNVHLRPLLPSCNISAESAQVYDTVVFEGPPVMAQKLWPPHCVQNTWGAELHKDLKVVQDAISIYKGNSPEIDSYSAFWDNMKLRPTPLICKLKERNITDIYVCGIAYDVCVGASALDGLTAGFRVSLIDDCCRGIDLDDIEETKQNIIKNHGLVISSNQVRAMVEGRDRRPELGYKLALEIRKMQSCPE